MSTVSTPATTRQYALPDWSALDTVWRRSLPFPLWKVGEQSLLYHWLDDAVDKGVERVVLYVADRPAEVRLAMESATLWPLAWEVRPVADPAGVEVDDTIDRLPGTPATPPPEAGWGLIHHWQMIEHTWLARFAEEVAEYPIDLGVGRGCQIHPSARLQPPYWIGDHVSIGPRCLIGPNAVVGEGALVGEGARIERAHLGDGTYLGPETDLIDSVLEGATLLNLKHRARIDRLEEFVAGQANGPTRPPQASPGERWLAFRLWWQWRKAATGKQVACDTFTGVDGNQWTLPKGLLPAHRRPLLKAVWQGRLPLFGPLPRPPVALQGLPEDWATLILAATPGALSYADVMGASPGTFEEALHTVYMLTDRSGRTNELCLSWARNLLRRHPLKSGFIELGGTHG
ncbi:MAG: hypothetical protein JJT96_09025 [Opitutales bacterium]|nr:hypothetical protein [Opitutales bacterium]